MNGWFVSQKPGNHKEKKFFRFNTRRALSIKITLVAKSVNSNELNKRSPTVERTKLQKPFHVRLLKFDFSFHKTGYTDQAHKVVAPAVPGVSAEHGPVDGVYRQDAIVAATDPR